MSKNVRLKLTDDEKFAQKIISNNTDYLRFNMQENNIDNLINKERQSRFNDEFDKHAEKLEQQRKEIESYQKGLEEDISKVEIMPLFDRIIVKPFAYNPFQRIKIDNGIITDIGGMNPNIEFDNNTGQYQERDQNIIVGTVIEVGPTCKYVKPGDTVFYLKQLPTPVPFFKQGFWTIKEENLIAVVNEGLTKRFEEIKNVD